MSNRITVLSIILISLLQAVLCTFQTSAQSISGGTDFQPDILVVKVKPEHLSYFTDSASIDGFRTLIAPVVLKSAVKLFPTSEVPTQEGHIDLTRIYCLTFSGIDKTELKSLAKKVLSFGAFEYAEVKYIHQQHAVVSVPNDPGAAVNGNQRYLSRMQAYEAWAIEKGDPSIVIGIVDTGVDYTHTDITGNIAYNTADPINGFDNDGDGYIDNYRGWDVADNDNNPMPYTGFTHGTEVAGTAGATTNNGIGMAGIGYNCRVMPIKASPNGTDAITKGYEGIQYAAQHGARIINLSWGGTDNYSAADQDVINYAVNNYGVLIVAAAGNSNEDAEYYPAAYDNVLSVIAMDTIYSPTAGKYIDTRANFKNWYCCFRATYNHTVDIGAQGFMIYTLRPSNGYAYSDGSSSASPIVAGAAGIVLSHYPQMTGLQAGELLRVTADPVDIYIENDSFIEKMGKGRVNLYKALTDQTSPAVRMISKTSSTKNGPYLFSGDTASLYCVFKNYLRNTNNLTIDLSSASSDVTILDNTFAAGVIDSMTTKNNASSMFRFVVKSTATDDQQIEFRLGYSDPVKGYTDYQYFKIVVNPSYVNIYNDSVKTTITSNGRYGYNDVNSTIGIGFEKNNSNLLYEGGLMIGCSAGKLSDCVRGFPAGYNTLDFKPLKNPRFIPVNYAFRETYSVFNDSSIYNANPLGLEIHQTSYTLNTPAFENTVFLQYQVINRSNQDFDSIYVGHFIDWDIQNYSTNRVDYDYPNTLGYAFNIQSKGLYAGITQLTDQENNFYAMDNTNVLGSNINPNDGFSKAEKFKSMSSGIGRPQAGTQTSGNDISMVMAARVNHLKKGDTAVVAFALMGANSLAELKSFSVNARSKFIELNTSPKPGNQSYKLCNKDTVNITISPATGNLFYFYDAAPAANSIPVHKGHVYSLSDVAKADTIYITNADSLYQSPYATYIIRDDQAPVANFAVTPATINSNTYFFNTSMKYQNLKWHFGDGDELLNVENPVHVYTATGTYNAYLVASDNGNCSDTLKKSITVNVLGTTTASALQFVRIYPVPVQQSLQFDMLTYTDPVGDISIINAIGQKLIDQKNSSISISNNRVDVSGLSPGIYFLNIKTSSQDLNLRFIKE